MTKIEMILNFDLQYGHNKAVVVTLGGQVFLMRRNRRGQQIGKLQALYSILKNRHKYRNQKIVLSRVQGLVKTRL